MKMNIWLANPNYRFGNNAFLPYAIGRLWAYAAADKAIQDDYELAGWIIFRDQIDSVLHEMARRQPHVLAVSAYIWNIGYIETLVAAVKERWPDCLIIAGGPQVPDPAHFDGNSYADILINGEGETAFKDTLIRYARNKVKPDQPTHTGEKSRIEKLDDLVSPYLSGLFDSFLEDRQFNWLALQETNRGCPYQCTFCVVESAEIITYHDTKIIRDAVPGDQVLGLVDDAPIFNRITNVKHTDNRECVEIITRTGSLKLTPDHCVYEKNKGWIEARECSRGDHLYRVQQASTEKKAHMFGRVSEAISQPKDEREAPAGAHDLSGAIRGIQDSSIGEDEEKQSDEKSRDSSKGEGREQRPQEPKLQTFSGRIGKAPETHAGSESNGRSADQSKGARINVNSYQTKQVRAAGNEIYRAARSAISLRWESGLLDRALQFWKMQKSRFYSYWRAEVGDLGQRRILASAGSACGTNGGLCLDGLQGIRDLVQKESRNKTGNSQSDHRLFWDEIIDIRPAGRHTVVDITVSTAHNFFANGLLVHNCDWGSVTFSQVRQFPTEVIYEEIKWFARNKIELLYNCDANFGMLKRDVDIARTLAASKAATGYPKTFRAAYAKKTTPQVYETALILAKAGMSKGVTLSVQSMDEDVLKTVKRRAIDEPEYRRLVAEYKAQDVPTYTEIILGLPKETGETFKAGIQRLLELGQHEGINIYPAILLTNSQMNDPAYRQDHGIITRRVPMLLLHGSPDNDPAPEQYDLIIQTATMNTSTWLDCMAFGWAVQGLHCLGFLRQWAIRNAEQNGINYADTYGSMIYESRTLAAIVGDLKQTLIDTLAGLATWNKADPLFGEVTYPPEELLFMRAVMKSDEIYSQLKLTAAEKNACRNDYIDTWEFGSLHEWARESVWYSRKGQRKKRAA